MDSYADKVRAILAKRGINRDSVREGLKKTGLFHEKPIYVKPDYEEGDPVMGGILGSGEGRPRPQAYPQPAPGGHYGQTLRDIEPPVVGKLGGEPPLDPQKDNLTIKARSGEFVVDQPTVDHFGPQVFENMQRQAHAASGDAPAGHYWGGGIVWNNPDYWDGRDRMDRFGDLWDQRGPQVQFPGYQPRTWNPNNFPPDLPPDTTQNPVHQSTPPRQQKASGGLVHPEPEGYYRGGRVGVGGMGFGGRFDPTSVQDNPFSMANLDPRTGAWFGGMARSNPFIGSFGPSSPAGYNPPPGLPGASQGPTQIPSYFNPQGYPWATPNTSDIPQGGYGHPSTPKKSNS